MKMPTDLREQAKQFWATRTDLAIDHVPELLALFAEQAIRRCVEIAERDDLVHNPPVLQGGAMAEAAYWAGFRQAEEMIARRIRKEFGVEG